MISVPGFAPIAIWYVPNRSPNTLLYVCIMQRPMSRLSTWGAHMGRTESPLTSGVRRVRLRMA
eukprot:1136093-Prorocentrum_lima.AAC.1